MLTVALIGADGAGKSSVAERLDTVLPFPMRRMYLGVSPTSATHPLPSTRLVRRIATLRGRATATGGPPPLPTPASSATPDRARPAAIARAALRVTNRIAEESYQEAISRWHRSCGRIVVYDRFYPADFHAHDLSGRADLPWDRRLHAAFLRRCFAPPDLVIVLDAEPAVLHARKGEGTLAELASRRAEYLDYAKSVEHAVLIRADRPMDEVVAEVVSAVQVAVERASAPSDAVPALRRRHRDPGDTQTVIS